MTERERLIKLLDERIAIQECSFSPDKPLTTDQLADYLLAHGVIVPPCKVGDVVYSPRAGGILEQRVEGIELGNKPQVCVAFKCDYLCDGCPHYQLYENMAGDGGCWGEYDEGTLTFDDFGKTVFLTREEAEAALAERRKA